MDLKDNSPLITIFLEKIESTRKLLQMTVVPKIGTGLLPCLLKSTGGFLSLQALIRSGSSRSPAYYSNNFLKAALLTSSAQP